MEDEYLPHEDFGFLTRAIHARDAANEHYEYVVQRLFAKYNIPSWGGIEPDGRITRERSDDGADNATSH